MASPSALVSYRNDGKLGTNVEKGLATMSADPHPLHPDLFQSLVPSGRYAKAASSRTDPVLLALLPVLKGCDIQRVVGIGAAQTAFRNRIQRFPPRIVLPADYTYPVRGERVSDGATGHVKKRPLCCFLGRFCTPCKVESKGRGEGGYQR